MAVKLFPLPKNFPDANLNTATFDRKGILWFTGQNGVYGRVDPATGKVDAWKAPKGPRPQWHHHDAEWRGLVRLARRRPYCENRYRERRCADRAAAQAGRRSAPHLVDSKGLLWVSFWRTGEVGRFDPIAKAWKVWRLPRSKDGCYAIYVDDKDKVWLSDWPANAILRFDPATEKFESFPSNRRGASVRQLLGRPGEAWGAESGTDRLVVVRD